MQYLCLLNGIKKANRGENFMYEVGMYGGSFNPLHLGHVKCIIKAATQCRELNIILSNGKNRDEVSVRVRYRWLYLLTKHIGNVRIHILEDTADSKEDYTSEYWQSDSEIVKKMIGKHIDVIFCGDDYDNDDNFYKKCYPDSDILFFKRDEISSTKIRTNIYKYWEWLPSVVRPYYVKKVLLIGGESVGKSTMTINLANYYNTNYVEEVGRELSEKSGTDKMMLAEDFTEILLKHKLKEMEAIEKSNKVLFIDTDCLITQFYMNFLDDKDQDYENNRTLSDAISDINSYDLVLFLEPDVQFVQDGTRNVEIQENREKYSNQIKDIFDKHNIKYEITNGDYLNRFEKITKLVDNIIGK